MNSKLKMEEVVVMTSRSMANELSPKDLYQFTYVGPSRYRPEDETCLVKGTLTNKS